MQRLADGANVSPRYPGYLLGAVSEEEMTAAADAAVQRSGGRGAIGPITRDARVLIVSTEDQDMGILGHLCDAMRRAGAAVVDHVFWSELGLPTGTYSAATGWRELSESRVETMIAKGERIEQDELHKYLDAHPGYTHVYAGDAGEGHYRIAVGSVFKANWMYRKREDLLARYTNVPAHLQRLIESKLVAMFGRAAGVRITDPEGTDISWDVTPEEAALWMKGAWIPWHILGTTIEGLRFAQVRGEGTSRIGSLEKFVPHARRHYPTINGVIAGTVNHTGFFPRLEVRVERGQIVSIEGGGQYGEMMRAIVERFRTTQYPGYPAPGYHFLNDATIGGNAKTFRAIETLWNTATPWYGGGNERYRAGVIHFGFGAEHDDPVFIEFGRQNRVPVKHMMHVHNYFATYEILDRASGEWFKVVDRGHLTALDDPAVRRVASMLADPDDFLGYDWVPAIPGINYPGDYLRDFAPDPVPWVERDMRGEFGEAVR